MTTPFAVHAHSEGGLRAAAAEIAPAVAEQPPKPRLDGRFLDVSPHNWLRLDSQGATRLITTGKHKLAMLLGVQPRVSVLAPLLLRRACCLLACMRPVYVHTRGACCAHAAAWHPPPTHAPRGLHARPQDLRLLDPRMVAAISPIAILVRENSIVVNLCTLRWCVATLRAGVPTLCAQLLPGVARPPLLHFSVAPLVPHSSITHRAHCTLSPPKHPNTLAAASSPRTTCLW